MTDRRRKPNPPRSRVAHMLRLHADDLELDDDIGTAEMMRARADVINHGRTTHDPCCT